MTAQERISIKAKLRTPYKNSAGVRVPGVTTVLGVIDKPFLVPWAWKLGTEGIDYRKHRDDLADVGTLAHEHTTNLLREFRDSTIYEVDTYEFTAFQIDRAARCFDSGLAWIRKHKIVPALVEHKLVSELHQYGGRFDLLGDVDELFTLADFKTGKAAYDNLFWQLAGYAIALEEDEEFQKIGRKIEQFMIVNIPRADSEQFQVRAKREVHLEKDLFLHARAIYSIKKALAKS